MSVTDHPGFSKNISLQWRNYSGELDVFEATQYFSGANETDHHPGYYNSPNLRQNPVKEIVRRMSLDLPQSSIKNITPQINHRMITETQTKEKKKYRQPSSPGARIASFLNSLFNQKSVKKKKKKLKSGGGYFPVTKNSAVDSKSIYSTSSSGFTTPPHVHANAPTKSSCKEFRSFSDPLQHAIPVPKTSSDENYAWPSDEKLICRNGSSAKVARNGNYNWVENLYSSSEGHEEQFRKFSHGGDSDSSSDLFDLPNYDLDICSSSTGLPVYETTQMDRIKKI
ncbi:protein BIG GRAIN 1-like E [Henckelia pumila]|uniref:protein BIG GRAIN 1-like E n=1 Tax=Henckelia pumila TaxID=405737 RepID=UPI003C6E7699